MIDEDVSGMMTSLSAFSDLGKMIKSTHGLFASEEGQKHLMIPHGNIIVFGCLAVDLTLDLVSEARMRKY
jgi:hypothetical protein